VLRGLRGVVMISRRFAMAVTLVLVLGGCGIEAIPSPLEFGPVKVGNKLEKPIKLRNSEGPLTYLKIAVTNEQLEAVFTKGTDECTGKTFFFVSECTVKIVFTPKAKGHYRGRLETEYEEFGAIYTNVYQDTMLGEGT
jgi:hypothetical protein